LKGQRAEKTGSGLLQLAAPGCWVAGGDVTGDAVPFAHTPGAACAMTKASGLE